MRSRLVAIVKGCGNQLISIQSARVMSRHASSLHYNAIHGLVQRARRLLWESQNPNSELHPMIGQLNVR